MRLSKEKIKKACKIKLLSLSKLLKKAGISKTTYYHLLNKDFILPSSLIKLSLALEVSPSELLQDIPIDEIKIRLLQQELDSILTKNPTIDRDNAWHTLLLLQEDPVMRLDRSLLRGRAHNIY
ncbi:MAG: helix-turn-helix domain-containing protein [Bdellovibrionales bacterium]|nr:helix-turn-helix domain-containing protein [Bdellovibrionales bacterium]